MKARRAEYMCPHCGWKFPTRRAKRGLVPPHPWEPSGMLRAFCPGSSQIPRNPLSDFRPLWKDLPKE